MPDKGNIAQTEERVPQEMADQAAVAPYVDIYENEDEYLVQADVPGCAEKDIEINLDRGELTLLAHRSRDEQNYLAQEYRSLDFRRSFRVPDTIDVENVRADLSSGVLTVHLPKSEGIKPRKIQVKAG